MKRKDKSRKGIVLVFVLLLAGLSIVTHQAFAQSSSGTEFWLAFPDNFYSGPGDIIITSEVATQGNVYSPFGFNQNFSVTAGGTTTVTIPSTLMIQGGGSVSNKGIRLSSDDPVSVYFLSLNYPTATNDMYLALQSEVLGTHYIVMAYPETLSARGFSTTYGPSQFTIVASEDNTSITITPASNTSDGRPAGTPFNIILDQFEAYQVQSSGALADVTGSIIEADQAIAVFGGGRCSDLPAGGCCCDHLVEQIPPVSTFGKVFDTIRFQPRGSEPGDVLRILASEDNTIVTINGVPQPVINTSEFFDINLTGPTHIVANEPICVAQYLTGAYTTGISRGDPFMSLIPPTEQFRLSYVFLTPSGYPYDYVSVVAPTAAISSLSLDGSPITASFTPIPGSVYSGATVSISDGGHTITGDERFGIYIYGYDDSYGTYGTVGGQDVRVLEADLRPIQYRWGSFLWDPFPTDFVGSVEVLIENVGDIEARDVVATVMSAPANTTVPDPNLDPIDSIAVGNAVWSSDTITVRVDMTNPVDQCEEIHWKIEWDDDSGHHVRVNIPEFPDGEGPSPCP